MNSIDYMNNKEARALAEAYAEIMAMPYPRTPGNERRITELRIEVGSAERGEYQQYYGWLRGLIRWWVR